MRDIKFRVRQGSKVLGYIETMPSFNCGVWFVTDLAVPEEDRILDCCSGHLFPTFREQNDIARLEYDQYTGKHDRNGQEMFAGDAVRVKYEYPDQRDISGNTMIKVDYIDYIVWDETMAGFALSKPESDCMDVAHYMEIIGDIYTTPDLIG